jgi:anti-anti-sigma factor
MRAKLSSRNDSIVISIDGKVDYETQDAVCDFINSTIKRNNRDQAAKQVIVNFTDLDFVGSSGITQFVQSLKQIHNDTDFTPKYCGVRSEFQKIIKAFDEENAFDFYDDTTLSKRNGKAILNQ